MREKHDKITRFAKFVIQWRWLVSLGTIVLVFALALGMKFIEFQTDYRIFFSDENPQLAAYEKLQNTYSRNDVLQFVLQPQSGDIFNPRFLENLRTLTEEFWQIPFTTRVSSIANFQHSYAEGDNLIVRDLVELNQSINLEDAKYIRNVVLNEPLIKDLLVSADGRTTAVSATLTLPSKSVNEVPLAMTKAREIAKKFEIENPGVRLEIVGNIALNSAFFESSQADGKTLFPGMIVVLLIMLAILLKSMGAVIITIFIIAFSVLTGWGVAGFLGIDMSTPSAGATVVIMTLAVADAIHILTTMFKEMRGGRTRWAAIEESMRVNCWPVFLTSITTVIGFLTLNFSDAPPFNDLGNICALGVTAAWALSMTLLPALAAIFPMKARINPSEGKFMEKIAELVIINKNKLLVISSVTAVVLFSMIPRIELNDEFVNYFDKSMPFRQAADFALENLTGVYRTEWSIPAKTSGGISDPEYLSRLDQFADFLRKQESVVHVSSITDTFKRLNKNMHGDSNEYYKLPEDRNLAAQYLLLYEMSLPQGLDLNNQISVDKSSTRIIATLENISTRELQKLDRAAKIWLEENFAHAENKNATGTFALFAYITERNINTMLLGTTLALALISGLLIFALKDLRLGLISLVPNLLPAGMAFGIWALLVGEVGLAASVIT
ncbi:MAG: RND transporter, partial [Proteobacteria bacterium]|nr:RND transporter [Pseudomonadota bacterium]